MSLTVPEPLIFAGADAVLVQMACDEWLEQWPYHEGAGVHLNEEEHAARDRMRDLQRRLREQFEFSLEAPQILELLEWWFAERSDFSFVSDENIDDMIRIRGYVSASLPSSQRYADEILGDDFVTGPLY